MVKPGTSFTRDSGLEILKASATSEDPLASTYFVLGQPVRDEAAAHTMAPSLPRDWMKDIDQDGLKKM